MSDSKNNDIEIITITDSSHDTLSVSPYVYTIDTSNISYTTMVTGSSYTIPDNITIDSITGSSFNWKINPFENGFPDWYDFQEMCKEYPGLEKTFEHLKVFYKLCHDEWQAKKKGKE